MIKQKQNANQNEETKSLNEATSSAGKLSEGSELYNDIGISKIEAKILQKFQFNQKDKN